MRFGKPLKICLAILCLLGFLPTGSPQFGGATSFMKKIKITKGKFVLVDDEDYDFLNQWKWFAMKGRHTYYAERNNWGKKPGGLFMHRVILKLTNPRIHCDHKDGNGLNNQRNNLRQCTNAQNRYNMRHREGGTSKHRGVDWFKAGKLWRVRINKDKQVFDLGYFKSEVDAAKAYNKRAMQLYGEFANLNKV